MTAPSTLWILTEERPKKEVLETILTKFAREKKLAAFVDPLRIVPILTNGSFSSTYKILGFVSNAVQTVYLKVISGNSSFVDYLVYFQDAQPTPDQRPLFGIEETKTDDSESRNTGVFQRASKFVYIDVFYPGLDTTMLYNLRVEEKKSASKTNIFGTKCLRTLNVAFLGKLPSAASAEPFKSVEEVIEFRAGMRPPPAGNVPILVKKISEDLITVSGRLVKSGSLSHDPNIGALSLISATLRKLGWTKRIQIVSHGLVQKNLGASNKFVQIANHLGLEIEGLQLPKPVFPEAYWKYESTSEKLGTIFIHLVVEEFSRGFSIYENHAGCERGYFFTAEGTPLAVGKRMTNSAGEMPADAEVISIPDLILLDPDRLELLNIEGERSVNVSKGIEQLKTFTNIENTYLKTYYPDFKIIRTVVLYGGTSEDITHIEVSLLVNNEGKILLGVEAPQLFQESIKNLFDFWKTL